MRFRSTDNLTPDDLEKYNERAAILEYDQGNERKEAERLAWNEVMLER